MGTSGPKWVEWVPKQHQKKLISKEKKHIRNDTNKNFILKKVISVTIKFEKCLFTMSRQYISTVSKSVSDSSIRECS